MKRSVWLAMALASAACAMTPDADVDAEELAVSKQTKVRAPGEIVAAASAFDWLDVAPENLLVITLERGEVLVALSPALAQSHVDRMRALVREGFFDGMSFYRVIDGFVAQGGDVRETRETRAGSDPLPAAFDEPLLAQQAFVALKDLDGFAPQSGFLASLPTGRAPDEGRIWHLHCAGAIAMARGDEKDTATTEFYIALQPQRYLDRNLTVFGRVVEGMAHIQGLRRVTPSEADDADLGETIVSMRIAADIDENERPAVQLLNSASPLFGELIEARRNRPEAFFHFRPDHLDVCQMPTPIRRTPTDEG